MHWDLLLRLLAAGLFGALIGFERKSRFKEAGMRTHFVVAVGSALIMIVSKYGFGDVLSAEGIQLDPSRIAAQVVSGIGFLGAGTIIVQRQSVRGLTTAAGLWATAGIGLAIGAGMYVLSLGGTILVVVGLELLNRTGNVLSLSTRRFTVQIEEDQGRIRDVTKTLESYGVTSKKFQISATVGDDEDGVLTLQLLVRLSKATNIQALLLDMKNLPGVKSARIDA
jgi:putative Mg2+ transporter-C (MgtC) family protein